MRKAIVNVFFIGFRNFLYIVYDMLIYHGVSVVIIITHEARVLFKKIGLLIGEPVASDFLCKQLVTSEAWAYSHSYQARIAKPGAVGRGRW